MQIINDLTFDDTFDIDQFEDVPTSGTKLRSARDLNEKDLLEDELQPVEAIESEDQNGGSWLMQSVKRVRRGLGRLFGSDSKSQNIEKTKSKQHKKRSHGERLAGEKKKRQHFTEGEGGQQQQRKKRKHVKPDEEPRPKKQSKKLLQITNKHNKRQSNGDDNFEGSGDEDDLYETDQWQMSFTLVEPWLEEYSEGPRNPQYETLRHQVETAFMEVISDLYGDDIDYGVKVKFVKVSQTSDNYKIHCVVQLELPKKMKDFGNRLREQISKYRRIGQNLTAELDENFSFQTDVSDHEYVDNVTPYGYDHDDNGFKYDCDQEVFTCGDGQEIPCIYRCDNKFDCDDETDEGKEMCETIFNEDELAAEDDRQNNHGNEDEHRGRHSGEEGNDDGYPQNRRSEEDERYPDGDSHYSEREHSHPSGGSDRSEGEGDRHYPESGNYPESNRYPESEHYPEGDRRYPESEHYPEGDRRYPESEHYPEGDRRYPESEHYPEGDRRYPESEHYPEGDRRYPESEHYPEGDHRYPESEHYPEGDRRYPESKHYPEGDRRYPEGNDPGYGSTGSRHSESDHEHPLGPHTDVSTNNELNCLINPNGEFLCRDGQTLPCYLRCNGQPDCEDHSDEAHEECSRTETDTDNGFDASTEGDIHIGGDIDFDGSGEGETHHFNGTETSPVYTSSQNGGGCRGDATYTCRQSGYVICDEHVCDGTEHCLDGEDEENCSNEDNNSYEKVCSANEFKCDNRCLPKEYQCNGVTECFDRTDEENCPGELAL
uniref:SEA domain-containing protein n=1 Tax=Glossina brevipalpis TaxID=37001 RepID=A0A1A9W8R9_9MUSC